MLRQGVRYAHAVRPRQACPVVPLHLPVFGLAQYSRRTAVGWCTVLQACRYMRTNEGS